MLHVILFVAGHKMVAHIVEADLAGVHALVHQHGHHDARNQYLAQQQLVHPHGEEAQHAIMSDFLDIFWTREAHVIV